MPRSCSPQLARLPVGRATAGMRWELLTLMLLLLQGSAAWAQRPARARPSAKADTTKQLSTRQVEEALRLFLRADSLHQAQVQPGMEAESEGFVLDQTLTKQGRDFYELFFGTMQENTGLGDYTIVVTERPLRGNSSLVAITVNDTELLEMPLPTRAEQQQEAVAAAVDAAREFLQQQQATTTQLANGNQNAPLPHPDRLWQPLRISDKFCFSIHYTSFSL
ncbi:CsgE family curli-type amyloid fiber assembly protein [Hymenobacter sp. BRD67]|uniref:CsgE family curli-type amyloid fiber assembly protein n=1 Tax=Hymenobacter sp. BRD67 TaxID=2675877 RepID=UPI0015647800|nr:CsgE family curli-type amyloid fiber assembly protein [Hymenobacter sp. BRD67]QKG53944.1 hypothetical protein GKZ67_16725 [Hymenobacter sp. BRD67]